jgi:hypothetical protein
MAKNGWLCLRRYLAEGRRDIFVGDSVVRVFAIGQAPMNPDGSPGAKWVKLGIKAPTSVEVIREEAIIKYKKQDGRDAPPRDGHFEEGGVP